jgi:hypothetical protein
VVLKKTISTGAGQLVEAVHPLTPLGSSEPHVYDFYPDAGGADWNVPAAPIIPTIHEMQNGATVVLPEGTAFACYATE